MSGFEFAFQVIMAVVGVVIALGVPFVGYHVVRIDGTLIKVSDQLSVLNGKVDVHEERSLNQKELIDTNSDRIRKLEE